MPNCDFYGVPSDHELILSWLFSDNSCRIYELASDFEKPLREFQAADEVLSQFARTHRGGESWSAVHLQVYVIGSGPNFVPRRVSLDPRACDGATFRYAADGWGLVQLYLHTVEKSGALRNSHTNHNSEKRAKAWEATHSELGPIDSWDFKRISSFSSRLNRYIRGLGVAKIGSRTILPGALERVESGITLLPRDSGSVVKVVRADA